METPSTTEHFIYRAPVALYLFVPALVEVPSTLIIEVYVDKILTETIKWDETSLLLYLYRDSRDTRWLDHLPPIATIQQDRIYPVPSMVLELPEEVRKMANSYDFKIITTNIHPSIQLRVQYRGKSATKGLMMWYETIQK